MKKTIIPLEELTKKQFITIATDKENYQDLIPLKFQKQFHEKPIMEQYFVMIIGLHDTNLLDTIFAWTCECIRTCEIDTIKYIVSWTKCLIKKSSTYGHYLNYGHSYPLAGHLTNYLTSLTKRENLSTQQQQNLVVEKDLIKEEVESVLNFYYQQEFRKKYGLFNDNKEFNPIKFINEVKHHGVLRNMFLSLELKDIDLSDISVRTYHALIHRKYFTTLKIWNFIQEHNSFKALLKIDGIGKVGANQIEALFVKNGCILK